MSRAWLATFSRLACCCCFSLTAVAQDGGQRSVLPSREWGGDHIASGFPDYVTGDECLFCHRDIGKSWPMNRHQLTLRPADTDDVAVRSFRAESVDEHVAGRAEFLLGHSRIVRFLKRSGEYGTLELSSIAYKPSTNGETAGEIVNGLQPLEWDRKKFGDRCAGCHTTAVDTATRAFSATSIDCFACHGEVDLAHTKNTQLVLLSDANRDPRIVTSICGQCHLRGGASRTSSLPYPNTFVAGDNLFRDFQVDLSADAISQLPPTERHVFENVHDVAVKGKTNTTCLTCHTIHAHDTNQHQSLDASKRCHTCHEVISDNFELTRAFLDARSSASSRVCEY